MKGFSDEKKGQSVNSSKQNRAFVPISLVINRPNKISYSDTILVSHTYDTNFMHGPNPINTMIRKSVKLLSKGQTNVLMAPTNLVVYRYDIGR